MLIAVSVALAHPDQYVHLHPTDPGMVSLAAFWVVAGLAFLGIALRTASGRGSAVESSDFSPTGG